MRNRIIEIAEAPARLRVERRQLVIESGDSSARVPLDDLAVLVVAHPQVSYTQAVLTELVSVGGAFVTCDQARFPVGLMLPLDAHSIQCDRFRKQLDLALTRKKQTWKQIIQAKITMQGLLLEEAKGDDGGLPALLPLVRSGDPANVEARAARRYWQRLFGQDFRRDRQAEDHNRLLNYGYSVLRAATARAIVAAGLHPSLGVHHHNRYNSFCLADDLMEPYRPIVDRAVVQLVEAADFVPVLDQLTRGKLLGALTQPLLCGGVQRTLFDALSRSAASLANIVTGEGQSLELPEGFVNAPA
ncbi:MAG: type II CRISPR-associated endonuclease Cas1 [Planctomycetaceae bacterium]|nr:type II CRISPR-associated endonuclease Cas1 [Planctomycetaceae bacterium]